MDLIGDSFAFFRQLFAAPSLIRYLYKIHSNRHTTQRHTHTFALAHWHPYMHAYLHIHANNQKHANKTNGGTRGVYVMLSIVVVADVVPSSFAVVVTRLFAN